jgi:hypothetical protein
LLALKAFTPATTIVDGLIPQEVVEVVLKAAGSCLRLERHHASEGMYTLVFTATLTIKGEVPCSLLPRLAWVTLCN